MIFTRYLELQSVHLLAEELRRTGVRSHRRTTQDGRLIGGHPISRGHLYVLLRNPVYIGRVVHKGTSYPGLHERIIEQSLWDRVQAMLDGNRVIDRRKGRSRIPSPLAGLVFESTGERLSPTHTSKAGGRYRYYVSSSSIQGRPSRDEAGKRWRIPATELEQVVVGALRSLLKDASGLSTLLGLNRRSPAGAKAVLEAADAFGASLNPDDPAMLRERLHQVLTRIEIGETSIVMAVSLAALRTAVGCREADDSDPSQHQIVIQVRVTKRGVEQKLIVGADVIAPAVPDEALLTAVARAHVWVEDLKAGRARDLTAIAEREGLLASYVRAHLPLAFLAPEIVTAILEGRQPADFSLKRVMYRTALSVEWSLQRRQLGFGR